MMKLHQLVKMKRTNLHEVVEMKQMNLHELVEMKLMNLHELVEMKTTKKKMKSERRMTKTVNLVPKKISIGIFGIFSRIYPLSKTTLEYNYWL
jgi:hypothetical protein